MIETKNSVLSASTPPHPTHPLSPHLVSELGHLVAGVHVLRVLDRRHPTERLYRLSTVDGAGAHAHRRVEAVHVNLLGRRKQTWMGMW